MSGWALACAAAVQSYARAVRWIHGIGARKARFMCAPGSGGCGLYHACNKSLQSVSTANVPEAVKAGHLL